MYLSPGPYTQVLQEQKIIFVKTTFPLINCSLLSFKLSTSKLLSERDRALLNVFSVLQLSAPWESALIFAVYLWDLTLSVTRVLPKGGGWVLKMQLLLKENGASYGNFWRFLQNLDENQNESLLYCQNEPARTSLISPKELIIKL